MNGKVDGKNAGMSDFPQKMLRTWTRRLLNDPMGFSARVGVPLLAGHYVDEGNKAQIAEAMAVWMAINSESAIYRKIESRLLFRTAHDHNNFYVARNAHAELVRSRLPEIMGATTNKYLDALCRYLLLPASVARKWVWHENVDLQSVESFLRRMTDEQLDSLRFHYVLVQVDTPQNELPCFADGLLNKVWGIFNPRFNEEEHMATKAAIAHDFFGMGMGFKLFPDATEDVPIRTDLASQFLSKRKRDSGDFEVNKEHGGLYWLLYSLRLSNHLYGEGRKVELGRWICPGFWFTLIFWAMFAIVSPLCFVAVLGLYATGGIVPWVLLCLGAISPAIFIAMGIKKLCGKSYDEEYWFLVFVTFILFVAGVLASWVIELVKGLPSFFVAVVGFVLLLPYCVTQKTYKFWEAPVMGKVISLLFVLTLLLDTYTYTDFFPECWVLALSVVGFLYESRYWVLGIALYISLAFGLFYLGNWMLKKTAAMIDAGDVLAYRIERFANGGAVVLMVAVAMILLYSEPLCCGEGDRLLLFVWVLPFLIFLAVSLATGTVYDLMKNKVERICANEFRGGTMRAIQRAVLSNSFWADIEHFTVRGQKLSKLLSASYTRDEEQVQWLLALVRAIKTDQELENVIVFARDSGLLCCGVVPEAIVLILAGEPRDVVWRKIIDVQRLREESSCVEPWWHHAGLVVSEFIGRRILPVVDVVIAVILWPFRMLWKVVVDVYRLVVAFKEQCPPSPPSERPLAQ